MRVPAFLKKYLFHPRLLESGVNGLPELQIGKAYVLIYESYRSTPYSTQPHDVYFCESSAGEHGGHARTYWMSKYSVGPNGGISLSGHFHWFGKGGNVILELTDAQQAIYQQFRSSMDSLDEKETELLTDREIEDLSRN